MSIYSVAVVMESQFMRTFAPLMQTNDTLSPSGSLAHPVLDAYDMGPGAMAFTTTRLGGFSSGAYASFNINPWCGDDADAVRRNREALCRVLGIADKHLVLPHQTHGTTVANITDDWADLPKARQREMLEGVDAVMTRVRGLCVGVSTADCIPILLYDSRRHVACAVHAGWRGTVGRIADVAVRAMKMCYDSHPEFIVAQIGPGIGLDAFEVGDEVYEAFCEAGFDMSGISRRDAKWHIDLAECNRRQLIAAGVPEQNISGGGVCTYRDHDRYFSARRLGIASGRLFTGIMLTGCQLDTVGVLRSTPEAERHPLIPFLPQDARVLFLGSFPPQRKRWCMDFYYPNFINDHWRIEGEVFFGDRDRFVRPGKSFDEGMIIDFCRQRGLAFFDTATCVRRQVGNASDKFLEVVEPTDVRALLGRLPKLRAVVVTGEKAAETLCQTMGVADVPKVGTCVPLPGIHNADGEAVQLWRLPSSSRAYPLAFAKKVEAYRSMFVATGLVEGDAAPRQ